MEDQFKCRDISRCLLAAAMLLAGCRADSFPSGIAGMYVSVGASEFSRVRDTLVLEQLESDRFAIHRRSAYTLLVEGRPGKEKSAQEEWTAVYDKIRRVLRETRMGKVIMPMPDGSKILVGKRLYTRLK